MPHEKILTDEQRKKRFWPARCAECGWLGASEELGGGEAMADTGDYNDVTCPKCTSTEITEVPDIKPRPAEEVIAENTAWIDQMAKDHGWEGKGEGVEGSEGRSLQGEGEKP